jgi:hypothetical protein
MVTKRANRCRMNFQERQLTPSSNKPESAYCQSDYRDRGFGYHLG